MNNQLWRDIPGFGGKYQINYNGQVRCIYEKSTGQVMARRIGHYTETSTNRKYVKVVKGDRKLPNHEHLILYIEDVLAEVFGKGDV